MKSQAGGKRLLALPTLLAKVLSAGCFSTYPQKARRKLDVVCVGNFINAWTGEISWPLLLWNTIYFDNTAQIPTREQWRRVLYWLKWLNCSGLWHTLTWTSQTAHPTSYFRTGKQAFLLRPSPNACSTSGNLSNFLQVSYNSGWCLMKVISWPKFLVNIFCFHYSFSTKYCRRC